MKEAEAMRIAVGKAREKAAAQEAAKEAAAEEAAIEDLSASRGGRDDADPAAPREEHAARTSPAPALKAGEAAGAGGTASAAGSPVFGRGRASLVAALGAGAAAHFTRCI